MQRKNPAFVFWHVPRLAHWFNEQSAKHRRDPSFLFGRGLIETYIRSRPTRLEIGHWWLRCAPHIVIDHWSTCRCCKRSSCRWMEIHIQYSPPLDEPTIFIGLKKWSHLPISHKVPTVLFDWQTQVLPTHVALFTQLTARELVNGLQPNTTEDPRDTSVDCHSDRLTLITSSTREEVQTGTYGETVDGGACSTVQTDVRETRILRDVTEN